MKTNSAEAVHVAFGRAVGVPLTQGLLLAWFLLFPSLGVVQKYFGSPVAFAYALGGSVVLVAAAARAPSLRQRLGRFGARWAGIAIVMLVAGFAVSLALLYPIATSGDVSWLSPSGLAGGGSDRDDALNLGARALLSGRYPYYDRTQLGNIPSQFPGSMLLATPFVMAGNVVWQNLFWFCGWLAALRYLLGDVRGVLAVAVLTFGASPVVMQDFVTGGDLGTNGIVVLVACVLLVWTLSPSVRPAGSGGSGWPGAPAILASMFAGVAFASRSHFVLILPLLFQLVSRRVGTRLAAGCLAVLLLSAVALTLPFYFFDPAGFAPLGLQNKFGLLFSRTVPGAGALFPAASIVAALVAAVVLRSSEWSEWLIACGIVLSLPAMMLAGLAVLSGSTNLGLSVYALPAVFFGVPGCALAVLSAAGPRESGPMVTRRRLARLGLVVGTLALMTFGLRAFMNSRFPLFGQSVHRIETDEKVVALTFDDGPHPQHTPRMLDLLDRHQVKATFFMLGRNVERHPDVVREVLARGHEVGNHSYSHPRMVFMAPARIREEITRTDALLRGLGVTGDIHFSPPHGSKLIVLPYVLTKMGKLSVLSDVDVEEWKRPPASVMTASALDQVRPGSVMAFHDVLGDETLQAVDHVVRALKASGYRFETVSELVTRARR